MSLLDKERRAKANAKRADARENDPDPVAASLRAIAKYRPATEDETRASRFRGLSQTQQPANSTATAAEGIPQS